jgi:hypothetical protein
VSRKCTNEAKAPTEIVHKLMGQATTLVPWGFPAVGDLQGVGPLEASRFQELQGAAQKLSGSLGVEVVLPGSPGLQDRRSHPGGKGRLPPHRRNPGGFQVRTQDLPGQPQSTTHAFGPPSIPTHAQLPVEASRILGHPFQEYHHVAEPEGAPKAMAEAMEGQETQMVFRGQDPDFYLLQLLHPSPFHQRLRRPVQELMEVFVELNRGLGPLRIQESPPCGWELAGGYEKVQVAVGPKTWLGVEASHSPTLPQDRLHALLPEERDHLLQVPLHDTSLEDLLAEAVPELTSPGNIREIPVFEPPPGQTGGAVSVEERGEPIQLG